MQSWPGRSALFTGDKQGRGAGAGPAPTQVWVHTLRSSLLVDFRGQLESPCRARTWVVLTLV